MLVLSPESEFAPGPCDGAYSADEFRKGGGGRSDDGMLLFTRRFCALLKSGVIMAEGK
ncbi:hypothetical protein B0G75_101806 [Paraburkholderia sp. BL18I3N2]|nr:hypothetical protein B0G75_101806 [Paraburkholderia sp. BL18I3N2]